MMQISLSCGGILSCQEIARAGVGLSRMSYWGCAPAPGCTGRSTGPTLRRNPTVGQ
jgi:hypothetical protein